MNENLRFNQEFLICDLKKVVIFHQDDSVETLLFRIPSRVLPFCPNLKIIREELARESVGFFTCGDDFLRSDPEDVSLHVVALRNACVIPSIQNSWI